VLGDLEPLLLDRSQPVRAASRARHSLYRHENPIDVCSKVRRRACHRGNLPLEDRVPERKVFQGLNEDKARRAMTNACKLGKIPHFTPKSLRHRRATIWHHGGVVARDLAARLGHTKASMSLDVYSHALDPGEVKLEELQARVGVVARV
jgi:integrase